MSAIEEPTSSDLHDAPLDGPDLDCLPALSRQLDTLDAVRAKGDLAAYVVAWLAISDQNGGYPVAFWAFAAAPDNPAEIIVGVHCDCQESERIVRREALHDHQRDVAGFRAALTAELVRRGRFADNRQTSLIRIKAAIRAFLATGGRFLIAPEGSPRRVREPIEVAPAADRFLKGDWSAADADAAAMMWRIAQQWRVQPKLARIIRTLGEVQSGWIVLEGARL